MSTDGKKLSKSIEVYGAGRRVHELAVIVTGASQMRLANVHSPFADESAACAARYGPDIAVDSAEVLLTHLVDSVVEEALRNGRPVIFVPPIAVVSPSALDNILLDADKIDVRMGNAPWMLGPAQRSLFLASEAVPKSTVLGLLHRLESPGEHLLARLAYPLAIACFGRERTPIAFRSEITLCLDHAEARLRSPDTLVSVRIVDRCGRPLHGLVGEEQWSEFSYTRLATEALAKRIQLALDEVEAARRFGWLNLAALSAVRDTHEVLCANGCGDDSRRVLPPSVDVGGDLHASSLVLAAWAQARPRT